MTRLTPRPDRRFQLCGASGRIYDFTLCASLHHLPEGPGIFAYLCMGRDEMAPPQVLYFGRAETGLAQVIPRHPKFEAAVGFGLDAYAVLEMGGPLDDVQADLVTGTPTALNARVEALREIAELTDRHRLLIRRVAAE
ncbi:MAG: hypothetical protein ACU0DK_10655 [Pseudooceanicola sp.]